MLKGIWSDRGPCLSPPSQQDEIELRAERPPVRQTAFDRCRDHLSPAHVAEEGSQILARETGGHLGHPVPIGIGLERSLRGRSGDVIHAPRSGRNETNARCNHIGTIERSTDRLEANAELRRPRRDGQRPIVADQEGARARRGPGALIPEEIGDRQGHRHLARAETHLRSERSIAVAEEHRYRIHDVGAHDVLVSITIEVRDSHVVGTGGGVGIALQKRSAALSP